MNTEMTSFEFKITSMDDAMQYAKLISDSDFAPKDYKGKPGNVLVAIQYGAEIGLKPLQSIQNIAVINGRPCIWGDAMIALIQSHPVCEYINETYSDDKAYCTVKRIGEPEYTKIFSKDDAKKAGLLGKSGPWSQYPERMMQMRARGFALRDKFSDILKGIHMREEVLDYQVIESANKKDASNSIKNLISTKYIEEPENSDEKYSIEYVLNFISKAKSMEELEEVKNFTTDLKEDELKKARTAYKEKEALINAVELPNTTLLSNEKNLIPVTDDYEKIKKKLLEAKSQDTLDLAADLISSLDEKYREELTEIYKSRTTLFKN